MKEIKSSITLSAFIIFFSFICLYIFTMVLGPIPFSVNSIQSTKSDLFSANGTGEVKGTPTTSRVSLGVTKTATTADQARSDANEVINQVTQALIGLGIEESKIKTTNFSVYPDPADSVQPLTTSAREGSVGTTTMIALPESATTGNRFTANVTLDVEAKDVETANKAIDAASSLGANSIGGASFDVTDEEREVLEDQARELAIKDAKEQAQKIAKAAGLKLGRLVNISESGGAMPMFMEARSSDLKVTTDSAPTDLQPGESTISVNVTLFYETL